MYIKHEHSSYRLCFQMMCFEKLSQWLRSQL